MLSRALPKDEHFALALHILKGAHPELVPEKVNYFSILLTDIFPSISNYQKLFFKLCTLHAGMGIIYHKFCSDR